MDVDAHGFKHFALNGAENAVEIGIGLIWRLVFSLASR